MAVRLLTGVLLLAGCCGSPVLGGEPPAEPPNFDVPPRPAGAFQLLDGDRVIFVGDTLIERAQNFDFIETFLTARYPDRNVIYRNLGWSGDTVYGDARAGFGTAADGFAQLRQQVFTLRPTVIFVGYGGSSSFDGAAGLERFEQGLATLLEMLETTKAELVLLSPVRHEDLGRPLPDPAQHNEALELYARAIANAARDREHRFVDLLHELAPAGLASETRLTENGIHLSAYGYWCAARALERALELAPSAWEVSLNADGQGAVTAGTALSDVTAENGKLKFTLTDDRLPEAPPPGPADAVRLIRVRGLPNGTYTLQVDGQSVLTAKAGEWAAGQRLRTGPEFDQVERLRKAIMVKNRLYFYRWRPQNETYLFGFRKHEQGQNAKEVPMFDPLVSKQEEKIAVLRVPLPHVYELVRTR